MIATMAQVCAEIDARSERSFELAFECGRLALENDELRAELGRQEDRYP